MSRSFSIGWSVVGRMACGWAACLAVAIESAPLAAQGIADGNPAIVIVGGIEQVWFSRQAEGEGVLQVLVDEATLKRTVASVPAPEQVTYIHVRRGSLNKFPRVGAKVRCGLNPGPHGTWNLVPSGLHVLADAPETNSAEDANIPDATLLPDDLPHSKPEEARGQLWGLQYSIIKLGTHTALRVDTLVPDSPASQAGLEVGDVLVAIDGQPIDVASLPVWSASALDKVVQFNVIDVNSGRLAQVAVRPVGSEPGHPAPPVELPQSPSEAQSPPEAQSPAEVPPPVSLGISAEPISLGPRSALKVLRVKPDSPAARAGLEEGDILVKANGTPLTRPEQLVAVLRKSGPRITLTVRDVRSGEEVAIEVSLTPTDASPPQRPAGNPNETTAPRSPAGKTPSAGARSRLGIVTELAFHENEAAVKITEIEPKSPAAVAGLRVGNLILRANDMAILHPNDLLDAEQAASREIVLRMVEPRTGREFQERIPLPTSQ